MPFPYTLPVNLGDIDASETDRQHWPGGRWQHPRRGLPMSWVKYGPYVSIRPAPAEAFADVADEISWIAGGRVKPLAMTAAAVVVKPGIRADRCLTAPCPSGAAEAFAPLVQVRVPVSASYTFGSVMPTEFSAFGDGFNVSGGVVQEKASPNAYGYYYSGGVYRTPMGSPLHSAKVTMALEAASTDRGAGVVVGADSPTCNSAVLVIGSVWDSPSATRIFSKVGAAYVEQATDGTRWTNGDQMECRVTRSSGGIYTYTVFKNGSATGLAWTDSGRVVIPGRYSGFGFRHAYTIFQWYSQGIKGTWFGADIV